MANSKKKRIAPFSLRLTSEERAQLEKDAGGLSLNAYIHSCLFCKDTKNRKRGKQPVKDFESLGKILGQLGRLQVANSLQEIAYAVQMGALEISPDTEKALRKACRDVRWLRDTLVSTLGLQPVEDRDDP